MTDVFSKEKRSEIMSRIRSKETEAERLVFKYLKDNKVYFQKHYARAAGTPDIALPRKKIAVFIDGDFWHGRSLDDLKRRKGEADFWTIKIGKNVERDIIGRRELANKGWAILSVWVSDIKRKATRDTVLQQIKSFIESA